MYYRDHIIQAAISSVMGIKNRQVISDDYLFDISDMKSEIQDFIAEIDEWNDSILDDEDNEEGVF